MKINKLNILRIILFIILFLFITTFFSDSIKLNMFRIMLDIDMRSNNLDNIVNDSIFNYNLSNFYEYINKNFYYNKNLYNCRYYTYLWLKWQKYHSNEYNSKIITLNNHLFVILYNKNKYIITDQNNVYEVKLNN